MGRLDWAREVFQGEKMAIQVLYLLGYASKFGKIVLKLSPII